MDVHVKKAHFGSIGLIDIEPFLWQIWWVREFQSLEWEKSHFEKNGIKNCDTN